MKKMKIYKQGEEITCPKCKSGEVDFNTVESNNMDAKCTACNLKFKVKQVAFWNDNKKKS